VTRREGRQFSRSGDSRRALSLLAIAGKAKTRETEKRHCPGRGLCDYRLRDYGDYGDSDYGDYAITDSDYAAITVTVQLIDSCGIAR